jgi:hypothetical protein
MAIHDKLDTKTIFSIVRNGIALVDKEVGNYYANGLRPTPAGLPPDMVTIYDGDHLQGIDGGGNHEPDGVVRDMAPVSLGTLAAESDFTESFSTTEAIDFSGSGAGPITISGAGYVDLLVTASNLMNFGFPEFSAGLSVDGATVVQSWSTNGAALGANLRFDFLTAKIMNRVSLFLSGAANTCVFKIEASTNKITWVTLKTGLAPVLAGYNHFDFLNTVAYKYYRLVLTGRTDPTEATFVTEIKAYTTDQCFLVSGFTDYDLSKFNDGLTVVKAFSTNGVAVNSYVGFKLAAAAKVNQLGLYMNDAGSTSTFSIKGSNDFVAFDTLATGFAPTLLGWNYVNYSNETAYKYYLLVLETDATVETTFCTEIAAAYTGKYFENHGFLVFDYDKLVDTLTVDTAIDVSGAAAGSYFTVAFDTPTVVSNLILNMSGAGFASTFKISGAASLAGPWTQLVAAFNPVNAGNNTQSLSNSTGYQYYKIELNENHPVEANTITEMYMNRSYFTKFTSTDVSTFNVGGTCLGVLKEHDSGAAYVLTHDISLTTVDLTGVDRVYFWVKSTVAEAVAATVRIQQAAIAPNDATVEILTPNVWTQCFIDMSAVADGDKNAIDTILVSIPGASTNKEILFDGLIGAAAACVEFEVTGFAPTGTVNLKVLAHRDMTVIPGDPGIAYVQLGDGTDFEDISMATGTETYLFTTMPQTDLDVTTSAGAAAKYTQATLYNFVITYARDYGVATDTTVRVFLNGTHRVLTGILLEEV